MKLLLIWIGKTKDRRLSELIDEYLHRLSKYARYDVRQLREARGAVEPAAVLEAEAGLILNAVASDVYKVVLDQRGEEFSSLAFARKVQQWQIKGVREAAFIIGGHFGFAERVRESADLIWSLSTLTLTHEMARLVLVEQLYRAFTIIHGHPYQK
jgi:23S rRNA (pseudouridine1915-N3)-methyltransferase